MQEYIKNWPEKYELRYFFEPKQGASYARQRAIDEARGEFVGFLDDDMEPSADWVAEAYKFGKNHPKAGAWGSQVHGRFESEPPKNFKRIEPFFAITERGSKPMLYEKKRFVLPPSGGLVVRKRTWAENVPENIFISGRTEEKNEWITGEDIETVIYMQKSGWEIWYNPAMKAYHHIPSSRLEEKYLINFFRGIGLGRYYTRVLRVKKWQRPIIFLLHMLNDLRKIVIHVIKYRWQIKTDLVARCEMQLYLSSLVSPFYFWTRKLFNRRDNG
jgi:GT2 family glycosyltransferase